MNFLSKFGIKSLKFNRFFIFAIKFPIIFFIAYYTNLNKSETVDISSGKNLLHYVMKFITFFARFLTLVIFTVEDFYRNHSYKNFELNSMEIKKILHREFLYKINEKNFKKILRRRKFLVVFQPLIHEGNFLIKNLKKITLKIFITFLLRVFRTFLNCFIIYRFCRFVDFINLHLMALIEILNKKFIETAGNEKIMIKRILAIRKCYLIILDMKDKFLLIVKWTTAIHFFVMLLSIIRRFYRMYTVIQGALPLREFACKFIRNFLLIREGFKIQKIQRFFFN